MADRLVGTDGKPRQRRQQRACDSCRKKKIKCVGGTPDLACLHCRNTTRQCTFEEQPKKRMITKKYVEELERRLAASESLIRSFEEGNVTADQLKSYASQPRLQEVDSESESSDEQDLSGSLSTSGAPKEQSTTTQVDELTDDVGKLALETGRYVGRSSGLPLAHSFSKELSRAARDRNPGIFVCDSNVRTPLAASPQGDRSFLVLAAAPADESSEHTRKRGMIASADAASFMECRMAADARVSMDVHPLPSRDLVDSLVGLYFHHFHASCPILHAPTFLEEVSAGKQDRQPAFRALLFSVLAIGSRFSDDPRTLDESGSGLGRPLGLTPTEDARGYPYWFSAWRLQTPVCSPASLYDLQSLCLSCLYLMGSNSLISAWITLGLVVRRAQDLGCQRQNNQIWTTTVLRDQLRKRLFWTIYIADRKLSAVLGRPLALHDEDIDVELPLEIDDAALTQLSNEEISPATSSPNLITGLNCQVRLAQICGRALNTVYSIKRDSKKNNEPVDLKPIAGLDSALNEWLSNLPAHLQWDPKRAHRTFGVQSAECLLNYYELQILVHRDLLAPEQRTDIGYPSLAICTNAARSIAHLLEGTRRAQLLERCWLTAPFAAISALLILLVNRSSPSAYRGLSGSSLMEMPKLVDALGVLAQRTFVAQRLYAKIKVNMTMHGSGPDSEIKRAREASTGPPLQHEDVNDVPPRKRERQPELVVPDASSNTRDLRMDTFNRDPCFGLSSTSPTTATQASSAASQPSSAAFYEQMLSLSDFTPFSQTDTHHQPPVESGLTDTSTVGYGTGSRITTNLGHSQHGRFSTYQAPATPPLVFNNDWFDQPQYWANLASAYASPSQFNAYSAFQSPP